MPDCEWCGRPPNEMTVSKIPHYCGEVWLCTDCASPDPGEKAQAYAEWKAARPEPSECRSCGEIEVLGERFLCAAYNKLRQ